MADVKWIKLKVGMFDGMSFKKIKKAKIGGESFRDKLTAVWFELMDFAGKCNHDGAFISPKEIPFTELSDIAVMIDRDEEELQLCMAFFIKEGMVSVVDDIYMLSSWSAYQNTDGLERIREQNKIRQAKYREKQKLLQGNVTDNVTITQGNEADKEEDKEEDKEIDKDNKEKKKKEKAHSAPSLTLFEKLYSKYKLSDSLISKMREWLTYKDERKEDYKEQGLKSLLRQVENKAKEYSDTAICNLIDDCMANNWKGIIFDRLKPQDKRDSKSFDTDEFFEAAVARAQDEMKAKAKTAAEDEDLRKRASDLAAELKEKYK